MEFGIEISIALTFFPLPCAILYVHFNDHYFFLLMNMEYFYFYVYHLQSHSSKSHRREIICLLG